MSINFNTTKVVNSDVISLENLILDVENYHNFLHWCKVVKLRCEGEEMITEVTIATIYSYKFNCKIKVSRGQDVQIDISGAKIMQFAFTGKWVLKPINSTEVRVFFTIDINFFLPFMERLIKPRMAKYCEEIVNCFLEELQQRRGKNA